jgi:hypothetical protein
LAVDLEFIKEALQSSRKGTKHPDMWRKKVLLILLAGIFGPSFVGQISANASERKKALVVETFSMSRCHGLDCPPWPTPRDGDFCFQIGDRFYAGISRPWGVPWARNAEKLERLRGQPVEIILGDKEIRVFTGWSTVHLKIVHNDPVFQLDACNHT